MDSNQASPPRRPRIEPMSGANSNRTNPPTFNAPTVTPSPATIEAICQCCKPKSTSLIGSLAKLSVLALLWLVVLGVVELNALTVGVLLLFLVTALASSATALAETRRK